MVRQSPRDSKRQQNEYTLQMNTFTFLRSTIFEIIETNQRIINKWRLLKFTTSVRGGHCGTCPGHQNPSYATALNLKISDNNHLLDGLSASKLEDVAQ